MSLLGQGAVAIWHDIVPQGRQDFYAWHGQEHMPERIGIPGFLRGRRYFAVRAGLEYFNLYEASAPEILASPDYLQRLNDPTPWTRSAVKQFRHVSRSICRVATTAGAGQGGLIATWRYDVSDDRSDEHLAAVSGRILPEIVASGIVAGAHLLVADTQLSAIDTAERQARGEPNTIPRWILLVEGWSDAASFTQLCQTSLSDQVLASTGAAGPADTGLYQLQATITPADLNSPDGG